MNAGLIITHIVGTLTEAGIFALSAYAFYGGAVAAWLAWRHLLINRNKR